MKRGVTQNFNFKFHQGSEKALIKKEKKLLVKLFQTATHIPFKRNLKILFTYRVKYHLSELTYSKIPLYNKISLNFYRNCKKN